MKRLLYLAAALCVLVPGRADGWIGSPPFWNTNQFDLYIDVGSVSNLDDISLTSGQFTYWVRYAFAKWLIQAGLDIDINYSGTTSDECWDQDGKNVVGVEPSWTFCGDPANLACNSPYSNIWGNRVESDICVVGDAGDWEVVASNVGINDNDLVYVLIHEFGHWLGLGHSTPVSSIMSKDTWIFSPSGRDLFGDDILGAWQRFSRVGNKPRWKSFSSSGGFSSNSYEFGLYSSVWKGLHGDIGPIYGTSSKYVSASSVYQSGAGVYFHRALYPLSSSSTWSHYYYSFPTWATPAVASNGLSGSAAQWLAVWPVARNVESDSCYLRIALSYNAFASLSLGSLTGCTSVDVALDWDPNSSRWVLIYKHFSFAIDGGKLRARTSTNGLSWTSEQELSMYSLDSPSLACISGEGCLLSYGRASSTIPTLVTRKINVSASTGTITNGSYTEGYLDVQTAPGTDAFYASGSGASFMTVAKEPDSATKEAGGIGDLYYNYDDSAPPYPVWVYENLPETRQPHDLAGHASSTIAYLLYVQHY